MTKKFSNPPVIILLDLLFMLVFILLISKKNKIEVIIPTYKIFQGANLIYKDNENIKYIINQNTKEKEKIFYPPNNVGFQYFQDCKTQCANYPSKYKGHLYIYFPNDLFNTISKITFIGSHTDYNCLKIKFDISLNGKIDFEKMINSNPCLKKIDGLDKLINEDTLNSN